MERIKKYIKVFLHALFWVTMCMVCLVCLFAPFVSACGKESLLPLLWYIFTIPLAVLDVYILNDVYDILNKL